MQNLSQTIKKFQQLNCSDPNLFATIPETTKRPKTSKGKHQKNRKKKKGSTTKNQELVTEEMTTPLATVTPTEESFNQNQNTTVVNRSGKRKNRKNKDKKDKPRRKKNRKNKKKQSSDKSTQTVSDIPS